MVFSRRRPCRHGIESWEMNSATPAAPRRRTRTFWPTLHASFDLTRNDNARTFQLPLKRKKKGKKKNSAKQNIKRLEMETKITFGYNFGLLQ